MVVLSGDEYKSFLERFSDLQLEGGKTYDSVPSPKTRSLTLLPKKSLLRIGMIMTGNAMARRVRNYLVDLEQECSLNRKSWLIQREVGIIERKRCMSAVAKYIPNSPFKKFAYPNYTNLIYFSIFGKKAKDLKDEKNISTDALRDSFSEKELEKIREAESIVSGLLAIGFSYNQIKDALLDKYSTERSIANSSTNQIDETIGASRSPCV